jgi:uncharacterized protein (DUF1800 family)
MQHLQRTLAAVLSLSLCSGTLPQNAMAAVPPSDRAAPHPAAPLSPDERTLHALNRFTFGPRPGDLESVKAQGLDRWFQQQLHPESIDNTALQARLAQFPAMQWTSADLLSRLPSNAIIRQVIDGKLPMPATGALEHVYANQVARVSYKREQDKLKQQAANNAPMQPQMQAQTAQPASMNGQMNGQSQGMVQQGQMNMEAAPPNAPPTAQPEFTPAQVNSILALAPHDRVVTLATMPQPKFDAFLKALKGPQRAALLADLPPDMKETVGGLENPDRVVVDELLSQRLTREIYSQAQLQEVMTDFWLNHFNVFLRKDEAMPYYLVSYERDTIRPHALGKFEDLLEQVAHSPAMLLYLDQSQSMGPNSAAAKKAEENAARKGDKKPKPQGLNENYARELMELHTVGVNGGYTQADVTEAARILTGWTVDQPQRGGGFQFNANRHEPGTKKVMGKKFKEGGEKEGRDLLHFLATRPTTAKFLSRKLALRFVSDDPPQALVDRMAKSYLSSDGDIARVLETMYRSQEFWSPQTYRAKIKTPLEYVVSAARASDANITNMQALINGLRDMGMPLYGAVPPTGYKWDAEDWVSTGALVNRMNFALSLAANRLNGITTTWAAQDPSIQLTAATIPPPEAEETRLESRLIAGGISETTRSAVLQQFAAQSAQSQTAQGQFAQNGPPSVPQMQQVKEPVGKKSTVAIPRVFQAPPNKLPPPPPIEKQDQVLAGLLLGSPEFQRR